MMSTVVCSVLTLILVLMQRWIIKKTGSLAVQADQAHYRGDLLMNAAVLLALVLVANSVLWADAAMAVLIAIYLFWNAGQLSRESFKHLLDEELPEALRQQIINKLNDLPEDAERQLAALFQDAEVIIHADPLSAVPAIEYPFARGAF
jgi:ferrous-iron efflux pump FieF